MSIVATEWMSDLKPAIGMVHLAALPGSPCCQGSMQQITAAALRDAEWLVEAGFDGLIVENFGDAPYYPARVPPITISAMTAVAAELRRRFAVPLGINVLRNDALAALSIASTVGANFIRVNVLCGARVTDQGIVEGVAHELLRERLRIAADEVQIWADVQVKHSAPLALRSLHDEASDVVNRGQADAVIVSGAATGRPAHLNDITEVKAAANDVPVLIGSGVNADNLADLLALADGFIVGSSIKQGGQADQPVDPQRAQRFVETLRDLI